jgi:hypothetical protein
MRRWCRLPPQPQDDHGDCLTQGSLTHSHSLAALLDPPADEGVDTGPHPAHCCVPFQLHSSRVHFLRQGGQMTLPPPVGASRCDGNGRKPMSAPPQPGCWSVAPLCPQAVHRAHRRSLSLEVSGRRKRSAPSAGTSRSRARARAWRGADHRGSSWYAETSWAGLEARQTHGVQPLGVVVDDESRPTYPPAPTRTAHAGRGR